MRRIGVLLVGMILTLGLVGIAPAAASHESKPSRGPDATGSYAVGRTTFDVVDPARDGRTFKVDVWYPSRSEDVVGRPKSVIDLLLAQTPSPLAYDNPPVAPHRFPLVVFSHGSGGIRYQNWFLMEHLASHGFIVAAPDHTGNTAVDGLFGTSTPFAVTARNRPLDVSLVISRMLERNRTERDAFDHHLLRRKIAVMGHSFGGFTAVAAATGWADVPPDPRVKAIIPIAAATQSFTDAQLRSITVPSLWLHGTSDITVPIAQTARAWSLQTASPRYRVDIRQAGHSSFTNACDILAALQNANAPASIISFLQQQAAEACGPGLIPIAAAQAITKATTLSFLELTLLHDHSYQRYLKHGYLKRLPVDFFRA
ncbi:MAG: alpha/beta hydrolase [Acidimicrobiia bacterium]